MLLEVVAARSRRPVVRSRSRVVVEAMPRRRAAVKAGPRSHRQVSGRPGQTGHTAAVWVHRVQVLRMGALRVKVPLDSWFSLQLTIISNG